MILAPCFGYQIIDSSASAKASSLLAAQCAMVKVTTCSLRKAPLGFVHSACPLRKASTRGIRSSGGTPTAKESRPTPILPTS